MKLHFHKTAIKGALLIDVNQKKSIENSLVIVEDEKIIYAGKMLESIGDCKVIDASNKTILPGIIDTHLHFSGNLSDNDTD